MNSQIIESTDPVQFDKFMNKFLADCTTEKMIPFIFNYSICYDAEKKELMRSCIIVFQKMDAAAILKAKGITTGG